MSSSLGFLVFFLLFSSLFFALSSSDRVFSAATTADVSFGQSSREPKFNIEFHSSESPFHSDEELEAMAMSNSEGKKYLCFLPKVEETKSSNPVSEHNTSSIVIGTEKASKLKTPDELLAVVLKDKCLYRQEGWWSYELCYQKSMRQVHVEDEKVIQQFVLGEFDAEATAAFYQNHSDISTLKDPRSKDASQRYHAHIYTNGTICDLTNQPRETEVRFVCEESTIMITSIKEISTCKYAVTVQCPMLCKHPLFQQERPTSHTIHCNELPDETEYEAGSQSSNQLTVMADDAGRFAT